MSWRDFSSSAWQVRQLDLERGALPLDALELDLTVQQAHDVAHDRETEARSPSSVACVPRLPERLEDRRLLLRGDAHTGVGHPEYDATVGRVARLDVDEDGALRREL